MSSCRRERERERERERAVLEFLYIFAWGWFPLGLSWNIYNIVIVFAACSSIYWHCYLLLIHTRFCTFNRELMRTDTSTYAANTCCCAGGCSRETAPQGLERWEGWEKRWFQGWVGWLKMSEWEDCSRERERGEKEYIYEMMIMITIKSDKWEIKKKEKMWTHHTRTRRGICQRCIS